MPRRWFRARDYGWGWYPASWQGWAVLGAWLVVFAGIMSNLDPNASPLWPMLLAFASVFALLVICWKTGERPYWRWAGRPISAGRGIAYSLVFVGIAIVVASLTAFLLSR